MRKISNRVKVKKRQQVMRVIIDSIVILIFSMFIALIITSNFSISVVSGCSMEPTLQDGDILIVNHNMSPKDQDIIVLSSEGNTIFNDKDLVKRYYADKSTDTEIWVEGDNKNASLDSRIAGTLHRDNIYGVVICNTTKFFRDMIIN